MPLTCTQVKSLDSWVSSILHLQREVWNLVQGKIIANQYLPLFYIIIFDLPKKKLCHRTNKDTNSIIHVLKPTLSPALLRPSSAHFSGPAPVFKMYQFIIFLVQPLFSGHAPSTVAFFPDPAHPFKSTASTYSICSVVFARFSTSCLTSSAQLPDT